MGNDDQKPTASPLAPSSEAPAAGAAASGSGLRTLATATTLIAALIGLATRYHACGKSLGEHVLAPEDCRSGMILQSTTKESSSPLSFGGPALGLRGQGVLQLGGICTSKCGEGTDDCPNTFSCYEGNCIPDGQKAEGEPCTDVWECKSRKCGASMLDALLARQESPDDAGAPMFLTVQGKCF